MQLITLSSHASRPYDQDHAKSWHVPQSDGPVSIIDTQL
jgi:hypothetical protein